MTQFTLDSANLKKVGHFAAVGGLSALGLGVLAALELKSGRYAFATAPTDDPAAPWTYLAISVGFGLMSFFAMSVAGILKRDMRKRFSAGAFAATLVALGCLLVPVGNLSASFAYDRAVKAWEANGPSAAQPLGSDVYQKALTVFSDSSEIDYRRDEAQKIITPPTKGEPNGLDWLKACFMHLLVLFFARAVQIPTPMTEGELRIIEAERLAELRSIAARKGAETRKRNAAAKKKAKPSKSNILKPAFGRG